MEQKAALDHQNPCEWVRSSTYEGSTAPEMICVWKKQTFQPLTLIILIVAVNVVAAPVYLVIAYLIDSILLAPTSAEVTEQLEVVRFRRKSAIHLANHQQQQALATEIQGVDREAMSDHPRPRLFKTFSKVEEGILSRQQTMRRTMSQTAFLENLRTETAEQASHFDSFENLCKDLATHSNWLVGRKHKQFIEHWPIDNVPAMVKLEEELQDVIKVSEEWKTTLKRTPPATRGIRLLQLFVQDLIGRKSRQALVFVNHLEEQQLEEKMVMSLGAKALAFAAIIIMNLYFIFSCMLYGRNNGWYS